MTQRPGSLIVTTVCEVAGLVEEEDIIQVKGAVYDVPGVGGVSFEVTGERTLMFLKHREDAPPDRAAISRAVAAVGRFELR